MIIYIFVVHVIGFDFKYNKGKCKTCGDIRALQKTKLDKATQMYCTQAHLMHRGGLFMLERQAYAKRRLRAMSLENRISKRILSIIIGMLTHLDLNC